MNSSIRFLAIVCLGLGAGACATITNGTTQGINVDSDPTGAECILMRGGAQLSAVTTPAPVTVKRDAQTIHVRCKKEGYEEALVVMNSRYETASAGNILLGGLCAMAALRPVAQWPDPLCERRITHWRFRPLDSGARTGYREQSGGRVESGDVPARPAQP